MGESKILWEIQKILVTSIFSYSLSVFSNADLRHQAHLTFPKDKFLHMSKLKALIVFADDKLDLAEKLKFVLERVENIVGKGEKPAFSPFPTIFSTLSLRKISM